MFKLVKRWLHKHAVVRGLLCLSCLLPISACNQAPLRQQSEDWTVTRLRLAEHTIAQGNYLAGYNLLVELFDYPDPAISNAARARVSENPQLLSAGEEAVKSAILDESMSFPPASLSNINSFSLAVKQSASWKKVIRYRLVNTTLDTERLIISLYPLAIAKIRERPAAMPGGATVSERIPVASITTPIAASASAKALATIDFPRQLKRQPVSAGDNQDSVWRWTTILKETGGHVGYQVQGEGYLQDQEGGKWGATGNSGIRREAITVPAGGTATNEYWVSGHQFCNGYAVFTWKGEDSMGHPIRLPEKVHLVGTDCGKPVASQEQPVLKTASFPPFTQLLSGPYIVRVRNPNTFDVTAGIRAGDKGIDWKIPANDAKSVNIPSGRYDIYFVYSDRPDALFQGDSFTITNRHIEIQIVQIIDGNYPIRQIK